MEFNGRATTHDGPRFDTVSSPGVDLPGTGFAAKQPSVVSAMHVIRFFAGRNESCDTIGLNSGRPLRIRENSIPAASQEMERGLGG